MIRGNAEPASFPVSNGLTLGRGPGNDVRLRSELASRQHAALYLVDGEVAIEDLGSANGIELNGREVRQALISSGDRIRVGDVELELTWAEETVGEDRPISSPVGADASVRVESALRGTISDASPNVASWLETLEFGDTPLERFAAGLAAALDAKAAVVLVRLVAGGPYGVAAEHPRSQTARPPISRALLARTEIAREALLLSAEASDLSDRESVVARQAGSALCAPVARDGDVLGALYAERGAGQPAFSSRELDTMAGIAHAAGTAISEALDGERRQALERRMLHGDDESAAPVLVGGSAPFLSVLDVVERVAGVSTTVLLQGERGSGKRTLARAIHDGASARNGPFLLVPCPELAAGREAALLTGVRIDGSRRPGLLADAAGGTLVLSELDRLSRAGQEVLAIALSEGVFVPVDDDREVALRCRIVATTCEPLQPLVDDGRFLDRLHSLLSLVVVRVPPLRARSEDIPLLARHFAAVHGMRLRSARARPDDDALELLSAYEFPGNLAELSNVIDRMVLLSTSDVLGADLVPGDLRAAAYRESPHGYSLEEAEKAAFIRALRASGGRKGAAAELLGVSWPTLTKKVRKYGLGDVN